MEEPIHKFDINLLKLSESNVLQIAKTEWHKIYTEQREERTGLCICQHKLKNITYMYNIVTKHTIIVGTGCCKKFNFGKISLGNNMFKTVIQRAIERGEYKIIDNILEYTFDIQTQLIAYIRKEYEDNITNLKELTNIIIHIHKLRADYDLNYLKDILREIIDTGNRMYKCETIEV